MNDQFAVQIKGLTKAYGLRSARKRPRNLVDSLKKPAQFVDFYLKREKKLALDKIWVDIPRGHAVALIGPNGAGKSTLLRILARIIEPTSGYADVYGSVGSLLELGVGFHPELSGRENIFLGGAILGMKRKLVEERLEEIIEFSGTADQIDEPIKHYSSGQYLRLGFAVAVFLTHDILLLDEILAVGDIEFQRRCMKKVQELITNGRTAIVVSHNFSMTSSLCTQAIYLRDGKLKISGEFQPTLAHYIRDSLEVHPSYGQKGEDWGPVIDSATLLGASDMRLVSGASLEFGLTISGGQTPAMVRPGLTILNARHNAIASAIGPQRISVEPGKKTSLNIKFEQCSLVPGIYSVRLFLLSEPDGQPPEMIDTMNMQPAFHVTSEPGMPALPENGDIEGIFKLLTVSEAVSKVG